MRQQTGSRNRGWLSAIGNRLSVAAGVALVAGMMAALAGSAQAATKYWRGGATPAAQRQVWTNAVNWESSPGAADSVGMPGSGDDVIIDHNSTNAPLLNFNILTLPYTINSLTIGTNTASGYNNSTLIFTNGNVSDKKLLVTGDVTIGATGTVTHAAETSTSTSIDSETQRLFLNVGGNLTIAAGGKIDVSSKGYVDQGGDGAGPGVGSALGLGSPGGYGGQGGSTSGGTTYGSVTNPVNSGSSGRRSGGTYGRAGGGTARVNVGGMLTLNGSILADGYVHYNTGSEAAGGGSGGSVNIVAGSLSGNGTISANGGGYSTANAGGSAGGGGRIAVVLTNANDSAFAGLTAIRTYSGPKSSGGGQYYGAPGTVYLKGTNQTYGTLIVNANSIDTTIGGDPIPARVTLIRNYTNLFDTIIVTNKAFYELGTDSVLDLSAGCALRSPTNDTANRFIVGGSNSRIQWPAAYTFTNVTVSWTGTNGMAITSDVTVASGAVLTHEAVTSSGSNPEDHKLIATIIGNLTIASGGKIYVSGKGYDINQGPGTGASQRGGGYGGQGGNNTPTYGSVTNPVNSGSGGGPYGGVASRGGGAVVLAIGGDLTLNGSVGADGTEPFIGASAYGGGGSGGSINIVAARLFGAGTISANGGSTPMGGGGGGGRIAVVLTNADNTAFANLTAIRTYGGSSSDVENGAAGTIYLKGNNQTYGRLIVDNNSLSTTRLTLLGSLVTDATVGDVWLRNLANMSINGGPTLTVYGSWSNAVATNAFSGGTVVLAGTSPATVWGGNTWSNLTITTAGKVVQFQTNVIQYVYGVPAWSNNVSLLPIQNGYVNNTYWKLFKPSWGATQDVGVVTVQWSDAMPNSGATFRAAMGSTVSDSRNWTFVIPKGTVFLLR